MPTTLEEELRAAFRGGLDGFRTYMEQAPGRVRSREHEVLRILWRDSALTCEEGAEMWEALVATRPPGVLLMGFLIALGHSRRISRGGWRTLSKQIVELCQERLADESDPEIRTLPKVYESLMELGEGRLHLCLSGLHGVFSVLPRDSRLRKYLIANLSIRCALSGVLKDLEPYWVSEGDWKPLPVTMLWDAVERGDLVQVERLRPAAEAQTKANPGNLPMLTSYMQLTGVMADARAGRPVRLPERGHAHPAMHQDLARQVALLSGHADSSMSGLHGNLLTSSLSSAMLPVFSALALGQLPMARVYLTQREQQTVKTPSDALAWAILLHLEGDGAAAHEQLETALSAAAHYGAYGRFDYDLRLVPGLSIAALLRSGPSGRRRFLPSTAPPMGVFARSEGEGVVMLGSSRVMQNVRQEIASAAESDLPVLIHGETGTGKELAARAIHQQGSRHKLPFIAVNCAAVADDLLLAELFGHAKGAFTGSTGERGGLIVEAGKGTIFLDEIGDATPRFQAALLRLFESGEYRRIGDDRVRRAECRIITATNVDLQRAVDDGRFRGDLRYRMERLVLRLPPLRERTEDIPLLLKHWLRGITLDDDLVAELTRRPWPGNIRELRNACERIAMRPEVPRRLDLAAWESFNRASGETVRLSSPSTTRSEYAPSPALEPLSSTAHRHESAAHLHGGERLEAMRQLFRRRTRLTRLELMHELGCAGSTATLDLKALCGEGFIEKVEPSRAPRSHYFRLREPAPSTP